LTGVSGAWVAIVTLDLSVDASSVSRVTTRRVTDVSGGTVDRGREEAFIAVDISGETSCRDIARVDFAGSGNTAESGHVLASQLRITGIVSAGISIITVDSGVSTSGGRVAGINSASISIITVCGGVGTSRDFVARFDGTSVVVITIGGGV